MLNMCLENPAVSFGVLTGSAGSAARQVPAARAPGRVFVQKARVCSLNLYVVGIRLAM